MKGRITATLIALALPLAAARAAIRSVSSSAIATAPPQQTSPNHPPLAPLKARGVQLFGYVSLGEADSTRPYFPDVARFLLGPNPNWPGAHYVDLRNPAWHGLILDRIIPDLLAQGFGGLFLDTLDDAAFLEHADPMRNRGMIKAAAALVREIHNRYPTIPLMLNRAYEVGLLVADALDTILAESLSSTYDFKSRRYHLRNKADLDWGLARAAELRQLNPRLRLYSLDYWEPSARAGIAFLYDRNRRAGFVPTSRPSTCNGSSPSHHGPSGGAPNESRGDTRRAALLGSAAAVAMTASISPAVSRDAGAIIPRRVLALYDGAIETQLKETSVHNLAAVPIEWLGLVLEYHDIQHGLPPIWTDQAYRGVLTWFPEPDLADYPAYVAWIERVAGAGLCVVQIGDAAPKPARDPTSSSSRHEAASSRRATRWPPIRPLASSSGSSTPSPFSPRRSRPPICPHPTRRPSADAAFTIAISTGTAGVR